ncbi:MAG: gliding motility-associated C-terminal domain-containing protein [Sphingobacteriaceae bacterium]|nr:gliding motility-associated C-terminal domain-containing protein [Sphingobacteriaceae bacterium]
MTSENSATTITISTPADPSIFDTTFLLAANSTITIPLTHRINFIENQPHNTLLNRGFLIESTELITAYYEVISAGNNPDIFALKGRNALGTDFYITAQNLMENVHGHERIDIVATENNTTVTIFNRAALAGGIATGSTTTITLNRGQTYSYRTNSQAANVSQAGTRITSNKPIAITYSDDSVRGGSEFGGGCYDLLGDQHIPVNLLGQEYIVMRGFLNQSPSLSNFAEIVLITAVQDSTLIQFNGGATTATLQTGQSFTYRLSDSTVFIQATKPIYVAHISGFGCETGLAILPSISCTGSRQVGFTRTTNEFFGINVMTKTVNISGFMLNGATIPSNLFRPVPGTGGVWQFTRLSYSTAQVPVGSGNLLTNALGPFHMGIINGGSSTGCRYGYFSDFARYPMSGSTNSPRGNPLCQGSTLELYADSLVGATYVWTNPAGSPFSSLQNPVIPNLSAVDTGAYLVIAIVDGCNSEPDTVWVGMKPLPGNPNPSNTGPFCINENIQLNADSLTGMTYLWSGPNGFSSSLRNPFVATASLADSGWYTVSVTLNGCTRQPDSTFVRVYEIPTPALASLASDSLCPGDVAQFSADSLSGASYAWMGPNGFTASIRTPQLSITGQAQTGWYLVRTTINGCTSLADSVLLTVVPGPIAVQIVSGSDSLCAGQTATLQVQAVVGYQYQWLRNDTLLVGDTTATLQVSSTGAYRVLVQAPQGCSDTSASTQISFTQTLPSTISANVFPTNLCGNDSILLTAPGGYTYQWLRNDTSLVGANTHQLWVNQAGNYTLIISDSSLCEQISNIIAVTANPIQLPSIQLSGNDSLCPGQAIQLTVSSADSIQWLFNGNPIAGANDTSLQVSQAGSYQIIVSNSNGCSDTTAAFQIWQQLTPQGQLSSNQSPQICIGDSLTLSFQGQNIQSFSWFRDGLALSHSDTLLTTTHPGNYRVFYTGIGGCMDSSNTLAITAFEAALVNVQIVNGGLICNGDSTLLRASSTSPINYQWQLNGVDLPNATNDSLWVRVIGSYSLVTTDTNNCNQSFGPFSIQQFTPANTQINANGPLQICAGDSVTISALDTPTYRYQWYRNGIVLTNDTLANLKTSEAGQYLVQITTSDNCSSNSSSLTVVVNPLPIATLLPNGSINLCSGDSLLLQGNPIATSYAWLLNGTLLNGANTNQLNATAGGTYQLVITNANGCRDTSESAVITQLSLPAATIGHNTPLNACMGDSVALFISNPSPLLSYEWERNGTALGTSNPILITNQNGSYQVVVTDTNGCSARSNTLVVNFAPVPNLVLLSDSNIDLCEFSVANLEVQPIPNHSYQWFHNGLVIPGANQTRFNATSGGLYRCQAISTQGCSNLSAEITINLLPLPVSIPASATASICEGNTLQLSAQAQAGGYRWRGPLGFTSTLQNPSILNAKPIQSGWYYLQTERNGCLSLADSVWVDIQPQLPDIQIQGKTRICVGNPIQFTATEVPNARYLWILPNGDSLVGRELTLENSWLSDSGTYILRVTRGSCAADELSINATVNDFKFFFPTAFTPNGDGLNDEFYPVTSFTGTYELRIYDRWGSVIFQTTDPQARWNGYIDGNLGAPSAYSYVLYYDGCRSAPEVVYGTVFLLR